MWLIRKFGQLKRQTWGKKGDTNTKMLLVFFKVNVQIKCNCLIKHVLLCSMWWDSKLKAWWHFVENKKVRKQWNITWNIQSLLRNFGINLSTWRICKILFCKCYWWRIPQCFNTDTAPLNLLKSFGPSHIEIELRGLAPEGGGSTEMMLSFLRMIGMMLNKKYNFELAQAYLALFLKVTIFL